MFMSVSLRSMTDAPEIRVKPQSKPKLTFCLSSILTHPCNYTLNYSGSKCSGNNIRVIVSLFVDETVLVTE